MRLDDCFQLNFALAELNSACDQPGSDHPNGLDFPNSGTIPPRPRSVESGLVNPGWNRPNRLDPLKSGFHALFDMAGETGWMAGVLG